jgi:ABC-type phosphate/phosphonate transport system substrate-binding protein
MTLIANARMYAVNGAVEARWRELFSWIAARSGVPLEVVAHAGPARLDELWRRDDLGAALMCGYPLAAWDNGLRPVPIAAPAPSPRPFGGRPVYWSDIVVRADSPFEREDDLAGRRFAWTTEDSQSGYQAPRRHFAKRALGRGGDFFGSVRGPLETPRRIVEAVVDGSIDAGPLDAYWHLLLRLHEPETAAHLRVIGRTEESQIPCFVTAGVVPHGLRARLAQAFVESIEARELGKTFADLALAGFARVDAHAYAELAGDARATDAAGYLRLR